MSLSGTNSPELCTAGTDECQAGDLRESEAEHTQQINTQLTKSDTAHNTNLPVRISTVSAAVDS